MKEILLSVIAGSLLSIAIAQVKQTNYAQETYQLLVKLSAENR